MQNTDRYSRQLQVAPMSISKQQQLAHAQILIVGLGGLGCHVGTNLAGAGVGHLKLVDFDEVELSNLHRQPLYGESDIGRSKAQCAKEKLNHRNSDICIEAFTERLNPRSLEHLANGVDLIIDAADNLMTTLVISDYCYAQRLPMLTASVNQTRGMMGIFCARNGQQLPSFRAAFPQVPRQQLNCNDTGVLGTSVATIASIQSQEALKILIDDDSALYSTVAYFDLWTYQMQRINLNKALEPKIPQVNIVTSDSLVNDDVILDVRNIDEIGQNKHSGMHIPLHELRTRYQELPADQRIICFCSSGQRALNAAQILLDNGFKDVAALAN